MKVAILYICTGRYACFFPGFYESAERCLLPEARKHYYVWTNDDALADGLDNVTLIHKECAGFPADSLFKFDLFLQVEEELKQYDYVYFMNSNTEVRHRVDKEILPDGTGLVAGVWHDSHSDISFLRFNYERDRKSLAYVAPFGRDYVYYMGGLNGGTPEAYLCMVRTLSHNIREDYKKGIIALWHDESHVNAYFRNRSCKKIGRDVCMAEEMMAGGDRPKIVFRNKVLLGECFAKNRRPALLVRLANIPKKVWTIIRWHVEYLLGK